MRKKNDKKILNRLIFSELRAQLNTIFINPKINRNKNPNNRSAVIIGEKTVIAYSAGGINFHQIRNSYVIRRNNFFIDLFGGYGPSNTHNEPHVTTGTTTPNGARIDFLTTTEQLEREIDLGLGVGGIYGNGVHVAFEPFYAIKKTQEIGDAIPRRYLNGELKGNDNAQPIYRDRVEKNIGVGLRVGKGRFSVHTRVKRKGGASLLLSITGEN